MKRIGLIDIGSNTIRLVVYAAANQQLTQIHNVKIPARLIQYVEDGKMNKEGIKRLADILQNIQNIADNLAVAELYPIATAAIRQSKNHHEIIKKVAEKSGVTIQILSEEQEASYGQYAILHAVQQEEGVTIDIGGASTEVTYFKERQSVFTHSFPFGAVTLKEQFAEEAKTNEELVAKVRQYVTERFLELPWLADLKGQPLIGVSGSARNIANVDKYLTGYPLADNHGFQMSRKHVQQVLAFFSETSQKKLAKLSALSRDRVDIILPATTVFETLMRYLDAPNLTFCNKGLREGFIYAQASEMLEVPQTTAKIRNHAIQQLIQKYVVLPELCESREAMVHHLIRELKKYKDVDVAPYKDLIHFGSSLYNVGYFIGRENAPHHTFYLVTNEPLDGFSHPEKVAMALIASYKNRELFQEFLAPFDEWYSEEQKNQLMLLGGLVKFSEFINLSHDMKDAPMELRQEKAGYTLYIDYQEATYVEQFRADRQKKHLENILGAPFTIVFGAPN